MIANATQNQRITQLVLVEAIERATTMIFNTALIALNIYLVSQNSLFSMPILIDCRNLIMKIVIAIIYTMTIKLKHTLLVEAGVLNILI